MALQRPLLAAELNCCGEIDSRTIGVQWAGTEASDARISLGVRTFKRPKGNDSEGVDALVRPEVVGLDVMPVACFLDARLINHTFNEGL